MKLTQNDIATIEQAHDYLLDKVKLRFDVPLLSKLRDLSNGMINKMDNVDDELFVLSKKEILEAYKSPGKLKGFAKDAFNPNIEKYRWYKVTYGNKIIYIYITEFISKSHFRCFGFDNNGFFFKEEDHEIIPSEEYTIPERLTISKKFKKEADRRGFVGYRISDYTLYYNYGYKYRIGNNIVFSNGIWLDENADINNLIDKAKELEKKHGLKITVTFE